MSIPENPMIAHTPIAVVSLSGDTLQLLEQWLPPGSSLETDIATHKTDINTHRHYRGETQERHSETLGN